MFVVLCAYTVCFMDRLSEANYNEGNLYKQYKYVSS